MQLISSKTGFLKSLFAAIFAFLVLGLQARAGGDVYEIYLNNKLVIRQALHAPLSLQNLELSTAKAGDKLSIRFLQCNAPGKTGKSRMISIRDEQGKIVKQWKFKDASGAGNEMVIPVEELLAVQRQARQPLFVFYSAEGMVKDQKLVALQPMDKRNI